MPPWAVGRVRSPAGNVSNKKPGSPAPGFDGLRAEVAAVQAAQAAQAA